MASKSVLIGGAVAAIASALAFVWPPLGRRAPDAAPEGHGSFFHASSFSKAHHDRREFSTPLGRKVDIQNHLGGNVVKGNDSDGDMNGLIDNLWLQPVEGSTGRCVATTIGPRTVLTAWHCAVPDQAQDAGLGNTPTVPAAPKRCEKSEDKCSVHLEFTHNGVLHKASATCRRIEASKGEKDIALCTVAGTGATLPQAADGAELMDLGLGEQAFDGHFATFTGCPGGQGHGVLNTVAVAAVQWPSAGAPAFSAQNVPAGKLCKGDSGAPLMRMEQGRRRIVAVLEQVDGSRVFSTALAMQAQASLIGQQEAICSLPKAKVAAGACRP